MTRVVSLGLLGALLLVSACTSNDDAPAECSGAPIVAYEGDQVMVMSSLEIGRAGDGFDLDGDGNPDNKLAALGALTNSSIKRSFDSYGFILPIELFDFPAVGVDDCVKFAMYVGSFRRDEDEDGAETASPGGDCNDHDQTVKKGAAEVPDDGQDNDCDGLADETEMVTATDAGVVSTVVPSANTDDADSDGVTIAAGDCDDHEPVVRGAMWPELCGDGLDNDCDGVADFGRELDGKAACSPFDDTPDQLAVDPSSFDPVTMEPVIKFQSAKVTKVGDSLRLEASPSLFVVRLSGGEDSTLELRISATRIEGEVVELAGGPGIENGRLGGVLDAHTLDQVRGLESSAVGLRKEDSLLDAMFTNVLGDLLSLKHNPMGCRMPDIDMDGDGMEAFCDTTPDDKIKVVDTCIDGDGRIFRDTDEVSCTELKNDDGSYMFVDGVSIEMNFSAVSALLGKT